MTRCRTGHNRFLTLASLPTFLPCRRRPAGGAARHEEAALSSRCWTGRHALLAPLWSSWRPQLAPTVCCATAYRPQAGGSLHAISAHSSIHRGSSRSRKQRSSRLPAVGRSPHASPSMPSIRGRRCSLSLHMHHSLAARAQHAFFLPYSTKQLRNQPILCRGRPMQRPHSMRPPPLSILCATSEAQL